MIESAARLVKEQSEPEEASILAALLAAFGARQYGNEAMRALIRRHFMSTELLDQLPLYREWVDKAKAEGLAEREARGEAVILRFWPLPSATMGSDHLDAQLPERLVERIGVIGAVANQSLRASRSRSGSRGWRRRG